ncbi:MAG: hypothetical protein JJT94_16400 [Bernardetiaceae bacterium]|nr:hypothetical protein [Bernardetiaceae bacterium]
MLFKKLPYLSLLLLVFVVLFTACEGADPDPRRRFVGSYDIEEIEIFTGFQDFYRIRIREVAHSDSLIHIENFFNTNRTIEATVVSRNRFAISRQRIGVFEVEGTGQLASSPSGFDEELRINFRVFVDGNTSADQYTAIGFR